MKTRKSTLCQLSLIPDSRLRVFIATIALGMELDCRNIRHVNHVGAPESIEDYIQQTGRDGEACFATLRHGKGLSKQSIKICSYIARIAAGKQCY